MTTIRGLSSLALYLLATGLLVGCSRPPAQPLTGDYNAATPSSGEAEEPVSSKEAREEVVAAQEEMQIAKREMRIDRTPDPDHPKSEIRNPKSEIGPAAPAPKPSEKSPAAAPPPAKPAEKPAATAAPSAKPGKKPAPAKVSPAPPTEKPTATAVPPAQSKKRKIGEERKEETSVAPRTSATRSPSPDETDKKASLVVLGEVLVVSHVPEPGTVPYTECLTFIKYKVVSVEGGEYEQSELLAVHWGMKDNKLTPAARYQVGEKHRLELEPFDDHPELARVMQADDTNEYELAPYWVRRG